MDSERFDSVPRSAPSTSAARQLSKQSKDDACLYCPRCSSRLVELKCKLLCEKCGYFMSCADYH